MIVVIKIGTAVLAGTNGLDHQLLCKLVQQICILKQELDWQIAIVTSGAVGTGRNNPRLRNFAIELPKHYDVELAVFQRQVLSAAGQTELMAEYLENFRAHKEECAQLLVTENDFREEHGHSLRAVTNNLLRAGIVPVCNTNDALTPEQLGFTDNDQLALAVAKMIGADQLIILTDVDGVFDGPPGDPKSKVIPVIHDPIEYRHCIDRAAGTGQGGMDSKFDVATAATSAGIDVRIANGRTDYILQHVADGRDVGTLFPSHN